MANEVVKYHNDLNTVIMRKWTAEEMNFFFAIIAKARNTGLKNLAFDTDELKEIVNFSQKNDKRWQETMKACAKKVTQLTYFEDDGKKFEVMTLFSRFTVDLEEKQVKVELSRNFEYILNRLEVQFTQYELAEFTNIRSTYAKSTYRLLKQWRTVGRKEFKIDEFKVLLDMPKYYLPTHIDRLAIKPILKELSQYFVGLKCKKIKSNKRGNPVIAYEFTWTPEVTSGEYIEGQFDYKKPAKIDKKLDNTPKWSNPNYKNNTSDDVKNELDDDFSDKLAKLRE